LDNRERKGGDLGRRYGSLIFFERIYCSLAISSKMLELAKVLVAYEKQMDEIERVLFLSTYKFDCL